MWKKIFNGDYKIRSDAKTFEVEFYYINFIDKAGKFESGITRELKLMLGDIFSQSFVRHTENSASSELHKIQSDDVKVP